jgi:hypothetical protein
MDKGCYNALCDQDPCTAAELSQSSYGCKYWAMKTALLDTVKGACFAAYVANTWTTPVKINVEYDGQALEVSKFAYVPKGQGSAITYEPYDTANGLGEPFLSILAKEDATAVKIRPKAAIVGGVGVVPANANEEKTYTLNRGEFLQIEQAAELTGSPITSDKPIGVWGGHSCLYMPLNKNACDSAQQQIPPVRALGNEYVGVSFRPRMGGEETKIPWRIVGMVDGTKLTWDVPEGAPLPAGLPEEIGLGAIVEFEHPGGFVVSSQDAAHPFYLSAYMTGGELWNDEGDPDWVNVIPPAQFLDNYVLFADPTYPETNLVVVRTRSKLANESFKDVMLDCLGPLTGWQPIGGDPADPESHLYEYTRVDLVTGNFEGVNGCSNGRREMSSALPFGVTVWGWGSNAAQGTQLVSYAYPAGASVQPINQVKVGTEPL